MPNFSKDDHIPRDFSKVLTVPSANTPECTIIALHGRGWAASKYRDDILNREVEGGGRNLQQLLPFVKFVFPQARLSRATKYRRSLIPQWYDGSGDWEPETLGGMGDAIRHIHQLILQEVEYWHGCTRRVILMGHSQGAATAMVSLLLWEGGPLGGLIGTCGFIPLNAHMTATLGLDSQASAALQAICDEYDDDDGDGDDDDDDDFFATEADPDVPALQVALDDLRNEAELSPRSRTSQDFFPWQKTSVLLLHGAEDDHVTSQHGLLASHLLQKMGIVSVTLEMFDKVGHTITAQMLERAAVFVQGLQSLWS